MVLTDKSSVIDSQHHPIGLTLPSVEVSGVVLHPRRTSPVHLFASLEGAQRRSGNSHHRLGGISFVFIFFV
jgi:hypothetical protein